MTGLKSIVDHDFEGKQRLSEMYDGMRFLEPLITDDIVAVATVNETKLAGLEYSVKTASSIKDKLERAKQERGVRANFKEEKFELSKLSQMKDVIRYTEICNHEDIFSKTDDTIRHMQERGYVLSEVKNYYKSPYPGTKYMGVHLNFISPHGQEIELQVHSPESFDVKQRGHELYEKIRAVSTSVEDKERYQKQIIEIHQSISRPKGYKELENFSLENKEEIITTRREKTKVETTKETHENGTSVIYNVSINGKEAASGFQHVFEDGSAWDYRFIEGKDTALFTSVNSDGIVTAKGSSQKLNIQMKELKEMSKTQVISHNKWMRENMPDISEIAEEQQQKVSEEHSEKKTHKNHDGNER